MVLNVYQTTSIMATFEDVSIFSFVSKIYDTVSCINYLRTQGLLATEMVCVRCAKSMTLSGKPTKVCRDGEQWTCGRCNTSKTIRDGSFFKVTQDNFYSQSSSKNKSGFHVYSFIAMNAVMFQYAILIITEIFLFDISGFSTCILLETLKRIDRKRGPDCIYPIAFGGHPRPIATNI